MILLYEFGEAFVHSFSVAIRTWTRLPADCMPLVVRSLRHRISWCASSLTVYEKKNYSNFLLFTFWQFGIIRTLFVWGGDERERCNADDRPNTFTKNTWTVLSISRAVYKSMNDAGNDPRVEPHSKLSRDDFLLCLLWSLTLCYCFGSSFSDVCMCVVLCIMQ